MTAVDFLTRSDIYDAQYCGGAHQGLIDRIVDWVVSAISGTDRKEVVNLVNDLCSKDAGKARAACDKLRDLLGYDNDTYFSHGEDDHGNLYTEFHPPVYEGASVTINRGPAGHMSHYVVANEFRSDSPQQSALDAYFPHFGAERDQAEVAINTLLSPYATDASKFQAARDLAAMKDTYLSHRVTVNGAASVEVDFGLQPLVKNFSLKMERMAIDKGLMWECITNGVQEDLEALEPCAQLQADIVRDDYYVEGQLISIPSNPLYAVAAFAAPLEQAGATDVQLDVLATVATQRVYGMILPALTWDKSPMIPSTSTVGGESKYEVFWEAHDKSVRLYITRRLDVCSGLATRLTEADVDCHYEMMQDPGTPIVKSLEIKIALKINKSGGIQIMGDPSYTYNPNIPE